MPHIKTIQAENIVIYSPRSTAMYNYDTIPSYQYPDQIYHAWKRDKNKFCFNDKQLRRNKCILVWRSEIFVELYKMKTFHPASFLSGSGYIMMYNKWLNYFPIFSAWKTIQKQYLKSILILGNNFWYHSKFIPNCPFNLNFEELDYSSICSKLI